MIILLSLLHGPAEARDLYVPSANYPLLQDAVQAAQNNDVIHLAPATLENTGYHIVTETIDIDGGRRIIIRGDGSPPNVANPPFEVNDPDTNENVYIEGAFADVLLGLGGPTDGLFRVDTDSTLILERVFIKGIEIFCADGEDNDGNGLVDSSEPACALFGGAPSDTAGGGLGVVETPDFNRVRMATVAPDGRLIVRESLIQGFSFSVIGSVIYADNAAEITIEDSIVAHNWSAVNLTPNFYWTYGYSPIHLRGVFDANIERSLFVNNVSRRGGAIHAIQGTDLEVRDSVFDGNEAEDGGAIWVESASLEAYNSIFVGNNANRVPLLDIWAPHQGGAVAAQDAELILRNNVFFGNSTLDHGAAVFAQRNLGISPEIVNNTFVDNVASDGAGTLVFDSTEFVFMNNSVTNSVGGALGALGWPSPAGPTVSYNQFNSTAPGASVYVMDLALFPVNTATNVFEPAQYRAYFSFDLNPDFRVQRFQPSLTSPLIDAGNPDPAYNDVGGSRNDIGAYGGPGADVVDGDGDGYEDIYDCDDSNASIYPGAFEACDDLDNDCNGNVDDRETIWFEDKDFDGWGDASVEGIPSCPEDTASNLDPNILYVDISGDCDDLNARRSPGNAEFCDGVDNDCDGLVDEDIPIRDQWPDRDGDGFGFQDPTQVVSRACPPPGFSPFATDCNDNDGTIHPLITVETRLHSVLADSDLEEHEADRDPSYVADGIDQDCDGVDLCFTDLDGDGFGAAPVAGGEPPYIRDNDLQCDNLSALTATDFTDCDDRDRDTWPGAAEVIGDSRDQNCDGRDLCYEDRDGDGYGNPDNPYPDNDLDCDNDSAPTSSRADDCNDDPDHLGTESNPEKSEVCDGVDNDCDGTIDEVTSPDAVEYFRDADGDGFGVVNDIIKACGLPSGYAERSGDCDDEEARSFPGATEVCDGIDNDCNGKADESSAIDVRTWYEDLDGDGYGNRDISEESCEAPTEGGPWVAAGKPLDCDDADAAVGPCQSLSCSGCAGAGPSDGAPLAVLMLGGLVLRRRRAGSR